MTTTIWLGCLTVAVLFDLAVIVHDRIAKARRALARCQQGIYTGSPTQATTPAAPLQHHGRHYAVRGRTALDRHVDEAIEVANS